MSCNHDLQLTNLSNRVYCHDCDQVWIPLQMDTAPTQKEEKCCTHENYIIPDGVSIIATVHCKCLCHTEKKCEKHGEINCIDHVCRLKASPILRINCEQENCSCHKPVEPEFESLIFTPDCPATPENIEKAGSIIQPDTPKENKKVPDEWYKDQPCSCGALGAHFCPKLSSYTKEEIDKRISALLDHITNIRCMAINAGVNDSSFVFMINDIAQKEVIELRKKFT